MKLSMVQLTDVDAIMAEAIVPLRGEAVKS
jgi:hypothetical protein